MASPSVPPIAEHDDVISLPRAKFHIGDLDGESDFHPTTAPTSRSRLSFADSPPTTPRTLSFAPVTNPFSPPASVRSFSTPTDTPMQTPGYLHSASSNYPFPEPSRGGITTSSSGADLSRTPSSQFASRPATADQPSSGRASLIGVGVRSSASREAFASPPPRPLTIYNTPTTPTKVLRDRPKSTMLMDEQQLEKTWLDKKGSSARLAYFITYGVTLLGIVAGVIKGYFDWKGLPVFTSNLCPVLDENFDSDQGVLGENGVFFREVDMSGFGNGQFEMTTDSPNNSFIHDGKLYILPTLTEDSIGTGAILDGHVYNITDCTFNVTRGISYTSSDDLGMPNATSSEDFDLDGYVRACSAVSNSTTGQIINPVQSARLSTRTSASIRYGKVEVRAKLPSGDWLWPAIWMLPVDNTYGAWPLSGEIDIMEARGNGPAYPKQGSNYVRGSLNWGPMSWLNAVAKTYGWWKLRRGSYAQDFHTYSIEWTEDFIRIYVDSRLFHMLETKMESSFWDRGEFPPVILNGSESIVLKNPWVNGSTSAPFDQKFYLILDVAVGGTNGWFPDGTEKPWLDGSLTAMKDFYLAKDEWFPTWSQNTEDRAFIIDSVKMWQQC